MHKRKIFLIWLLLTFLIQLIADHIMRSMFDRVAYWFLTAVAAGCGLLTYAIVKLAWRKKAG